MPDIPDRDELERQYARLIAKLLNAYGGRLLEKLGDPPSMDNLPADFWDNEAKELMRGLSPFGQRVFLEAAERLMAETPIGVDWALINKHAMEWVNPYIQKLVEGLTKTNQDAVYTAMRNYWELGLTRGELEDQLASVFMSPVRASMIAVTEITRAAVEGQRAYVDELIKSTGIEMVEFWITKNDDLVCEICEPLNEKRIGDGWTRADGPPAHVNCRCDTGFELPKAEEETTQPLEQEQPGGRAPAGGIIGINQEFYEGGQFLPNTTLGKMTPEQKRDLDKKKKYMDKKQPVAPGIWDKPPTPDHYSIFRTLAGNVSTINKDTGIMEKMGQATIDYYTNGTGRIAGYSLDDLINAYNRGERWYPFEPFQPK